MRVVTSFGLSLVALGAIGSTTMMMPACGSSEQTSSSSGSGSGSGSSSGGTSGGDAGPYGGPAGAPCAADAGQVPNPECDDGTETSCGTTLLCQALATNPNPECGDLTTCEPLANNTGTTKNFRMRRIILAAPAALATSAVQNTVVTNGVDMNEPQCGELGTGDFSWLVSVDTAGKTITTGGAPPCDLTDSPSCSPFTKGYCFVHKTVAAGTQTIDIAPVSGPYTTQADGTIWTQPGLIPLLNVPIYFQGSIIILPINYGAIQGVTISPDGNCIGSVNVDAMNKDCSDNYTNCSKWKTGGTLTGYITLNQANQVEVQLLGKTLCALLTGDSSGTTLPGACQVDSSGNVIDKGDYCSTSNPPGPATATCADSYWLAATFAASAVTIYDGTGTPDCLGGGDAGSQVDSGPGADSGAPADAGTD